MTVSIEQLNQLENILKYAQEVEKSKLDTHIKSALIFNTHISQKADNILDNLGFSPNDSLTNKNSIKEFCKSLEHDLKLLEKGELRALLLLKPKF